MVYLAFIVIFCVSSSFSCAWFSLQFNVWVFARPGFSSLSRYRLVSISFVSFAFLDCLIAFVQLQGVTRDYKSLHVVTRGFRRLKGITRGYRGLEEVTGGY